MLATFPTTQLSKILVMKQLVLQNVSPSRRDYVTRVTPVLNKFSRFCLVYHTLTTTPAPKEKLIKQLNK